MKRRVSSLFTLGVLLLSFVCIFIQFPTASANSTLGNSGTYSATTGATNNQIYFMGPYTATTTGLITTVNMYTQGTSVNPTNMVIAIYSNSGSNTPQTLLSVSSAVDVYNTTGFYWYSFSGFSITVNSGSSYWFAVLTDQGFNIGRIATGSWTIRYESSGISYPTFPATATSIAGSTTTLPMIYATVLSDSLTPSSISATAYVGLAPTFTATWTTNNTLSHYIVETNRTGSPVNETATAFTTTTSTYTPSWTLPNIGVLQWRIFANTTLGIWANTGLQNTTVVYVNFAITGPYIEDNGAVANTIVAGTVYFTNGMSQTFTLDGTTGNAQTYGVNPSYTPLSVTWQAIANYSYTRTYYLTGTTAANVTVFVPNPASTPQIYQFTISDFYGITNPYIASSLPVGGNLTSQTYIIERKPLTVGTVSFVMEQWHGYTLQVQCDQGTYSVEFSAEGTFLTNINVPSGAFPVSNVTYPVADAQRTNSTAITVTYLDNSGGTTSLSISIYHRNGLVNVVDQTFTGTSSVETLVWNDAESAMDYTVNVTAVSNSTTYRYMFITPAVMSSNPFTGLLDWLGPSIATLPHVSVGWPAGVDPAQLFAAILIVAALCVGSFRSAGVSCLIAGFVGGILIVLGWWQSAIPIWSFALVVGVLIAIDEWRQSNGGYIAT